MPVLLQGSCRCGAIAFSLESHTPVPYQLCYCSICRKTAGGGGYAINLMGMRKSLEVSDAKALRVYRAEIEAPDGSCQTSEGQRHFCPRCASALWLWDERWPDLVHPFASAIDSPLPMPSQLTHLMLRFKPDWVVPTFGTEDQTFDLYPDESIEEWHRARGQWVD